MIFYFSGTGNSEYVAKKLLGSEETLVNIAEALKSKTFAYEIKPEEQVGIVFPVYFYTLPTLVREFIQKIELKGNSYIYSVITCGGGICQAGSVLKKELKARNLELNFVQKLLMPDNSMLFYQIPGNDGAEELIKKADIIIEDIKARIDKRETQKIGDITILSDLVNLGYKACSKTEKFYAMNSCISCGLCAQNCPEDIIRIVDGKPSWEKNKCSKCSACINRCPTKAIQYGKLTIKRNRYVNPKLR